MSFRIRRIFIFATKDEKWQYEADVFFQII